MVIPRIIINKNNRINPLLSCNNLKSGKKLSINKTVPQIVTMAIIEAMNPKEFLEKHNLKKIGKIGNFDTI